MTTTLASLEASFKGAFTLAVQEVQDTATLANQRKTIAARKQEWSDALATLDMDKLETVDQAMQSYVTELATISVPTEPTALSTDQAGALMAEYIRLETIAEFLQVRRDIMKVLVFGSLDADLGVGKPGAIKVPGLKKQFKREGGGYADPTINVEKLVALLGEDATQVFDTVEVPEVVTPAHTEFVFNEDKLIGLVQTRPELLDQIAKSAVDPGKEKVARFTIRDLK